MQLIYYGDSLKHHGVKGQRGGVRRYQPYPKGSKKKGKVIGKAAKEESSEKRSFLKNYKSGISERYKNKTPKDMISKTLSDASLGTLATVGANHLAKLSGSDFLTIGVTSLMAGSTVGQFINNAAGTINALKTRKV